MDADIPAKPSSVTVPLSIATTLLGVILAVAAFLGTATVSQGRETSALNTEMRNVREETRYVRGRLDAIIERLDALSERMVSR